MQDLQKMLKDKVQFSYPEKHKKQKKIIRKEIKIVRVDLNDKELTQKLSDSGIHFPMGTTIVLVIDGRSFKYDGVIDNATILVHNLQRLANPVISLTKEDQIMSFLDTSDPKIWPDDYSGVLCAKG